MLTSLLLLGFAMGLRHALEADHVATVASLASRSSRPRDLLVVAGLWGIGHGLVLVGVGGLVLVAGLAIPGGVSSFLELMVGLVLVCLGGDVARRARRKRLHFHPHRHADGTRHLHAHLHEGGAGDHEHAHPPWRRVLAVGALHGSAGSAALLLVLVQPLGPGRALAYVATYAIGAIAGMLLLSCAAVLPLRWGAARLAGARPALELGVGISGIALGLVVTLRAGAALLL